MSMTGTPLAAATVPLAEAFRSEIREARKAGFRIELSNLDGAVAVRLVPETPTARTAARKAAPDVFEPMIEATCHVPDDATVLDRLDYVRETIASALVLVRDCS